MALQLPSMFAFRVEDLWPVAVPCVLGAASVFLLLPKAAGGRTALTGALLGGVGLLVAASLLVQTGVFSAETVLFYIFAALTIVAGVLLVTQRNPARAALSFALVVLSTCGLFLLLAAPFLMAATIIIYAGAIIVTFLFVIMLASQAGITDADARTREPLLATALGFLLLGCLIYVLQVSYETNATVQLIEAQLNETRKKKARLSKDDLARLETFPQTVQDELRKGYLDEKGLERGGGTDELKKLDRVIEEIKLDWPGTAAANVETVQNALSKLEAVLEQALQQRGWLPAAVGERNIASNLSGPPAIERPATPEQAWRYDDEGRPHMPADNSAFLGRSLFTDFLLPVELGGVLLLVATIGAVAIAQRRTTPARHS
jgi:NADH-quinone oxidoreductase subunit J